MFVYYKIFRSTRQRLRSRAKASNLGALRSKKENNAGSNNSNNSKPTCCNNGSAGEQMALVAMASKEAEAAAAKGGANQKVVETKVGGTWTLLYYTYYIQISDCFSRSILVMSAPILGLQHEWRKLSGITQSFWWFPDKIFLYSEQTRKGFIVILLQDRSENWTHDI